MKNRLNKIFACSCIVLILYSCTKAIQIDPPIGQLESQVVFNDNGTASAAVAGIFQHMSNTGLSDGATGISLTAGLLSDELTNYNAGDIFLPGFYANALNSGNSYFWTEIYQNIYASNAAIEGLTSSTVVNAGLKTQLLGEAKFIRAFLNFYAVNLYGDVPLVMSTDYRTNNNSSRSPISSVYHQIITDLAEAQTELDDNYMDPSGTVSSERVLPNRSAATALLARAYLYTGNWTGADSAATAVINSSMYNLSNDLDSSFLANSTEAILQLQSVIPGINTYDGIYFVLQSPPGPGNNPVALSPNLIGAFEPGDARFSHWTSSFVSDTQTFYYPFKYKVFLYDQPVTEYTMVLRLAEQYLIRAEAKLQQNDISGALANLNVIRKRANLPDYAGPNDQNEVLNAILHERQVELFTEWGHRWFDLKRTGMINSVMGSPGNVTQSKGGVWDPNSALFPLPQSEILINPNLKQNPGYN